MLVNTSMFMNSWVERLVIGKTADNKYICVDDGYEQNYIVGKPFKAFLCDTVREIQIKKETVELTLQEIANKFNTDVKNIKIVEK